MTRPPTELARHAVPDVVLDPPRFSCSFCGKSEVEVRRIVHGPSVYICDECVAFCVEELRDNGVEVGVLDTTGAEVSP